MIKLILHRILQTLPTLFILITLSFFAMRIAPGSPFTTEKGYSPEVMHNIEAKYHLDKPLIEQYGYYHYFWICFFLAIPGMLILFKIAPWKEGNVGQPRL